MGQKIALVLSGGGAKGLAHIGAIETLEKYGFEISSIAGTSAGSLIGGIYAMGKLDIFSDWVKKLKKREMIGLMDFSLGIKGLLKGEKFFEKLRTFIPDVNIENLDIPFCAVATDILHEKEVIFDKGSMFDAIRASISIPDIFVPVKYNNTLLVDGGVLNPTPINVVKRTEGDIVVVVDLYSNINFIEKEIQIEEIQKDTEKLSGHLKRLRKHISKSIKDKDKLSAGYLKLLDLSTGAMVNRISALTIEKYKPDIVISVASNVAGIFDFFKGTELIKYGKEQAEKSIREYLGKQT